MPILKFPSRKDEPAFLRDIEEDGSHIYNRNNAKTPGYYPHCKDFLCTTIKTTTSLTRMTL
jgi:hypothetical protein